MQPSDPKQIQTSGTLMITQEGVVKEILFTIKSDGLEEAKHFFNTLNNHFSIEPGWAKTALEIRTLFAELRKEEDEKKIEKEVDRRLAEIQKKMIPAIYLTVNQLQSVQEEKIDNKFESGSNSQVFNGNVTGDFNKEKN